MEILFILNIHFKNALSTFFLAKCTILQAFMAFTVIPYYFFLNFLIVLPIFIFQILALLSDFSKHSLKFKVTHFLPNRFRVLGLEKIYYLLFMPNCFRCLIINSFSSFFPFSENIFEMIFTNF